jgi:integrase/recombinase XerD
VRIPDTPDNLKHQTMLKTCYNTRLRISELLTLKVADIDSERMLLRIAQGKGAKDRLVPLSPVLLDCLRQYWRQARPHTWLFPSEQTLRPLCPTTISKVFKESKRKAGVSKKGEQCWQPIRTMFISTGKITGTINKKSCH